MSTRQLIVIVEDDAAIRRLMAEMVAPLAEVVEAADEDEAMALIGHRLPDLVLLDLDLATPGGADGRTICRRIKRMAGEAAVHVMLVSASSDPATRMAGYEAGADDFLAKPFDRRELVAKTTVHLRHARALTTVSALERASASAADRLSDIVEEQARGIIVARTMTARALAALAENRDTDTGEHLDRMRDYAVAIAEELCRDERHAEAVDGAFMEQLHHAAPLHDIGKVAIPDAILQKPGRLTAEEFDIMKTHAAAGASVLEAIRSLECDGGIGDDASFMPMAVSVARSHHERWDGTGYPDGLAGEEIPLAARITAVADVLDALASTRVYKDALPFDDARSIILEGRGSHFDPSIVDAFERAWPRLVEIRERFLRRRDAAVPAPRTDAADPAPATARAA